MCGLKTRPEPQTEGNAGPPAPAWLPFPAFSGLSVEQGLLGFMPTALPGEGQGCQCRQLLPPLPALGSREETVGSCRGPCFPWPRSMVTFQRVAFHAGCPSREEVSPSASGRDSCLSWEAFPQGRLSRNRSCGAESPDRLLAARSQLSVSRLSPPPGCLQTRHLLSYPGPEEAEAILRTPIFHSTQYRLAAHPVVPPPSLTCVMRDVVTR